MHAEKLLKKANKTKPLKKVGTLLDLTQRTPKITGNERLLLLLQSSHPHSGNVLAKVNMPVSSLIQPVHVLSSLEKKMTKGDYTSQ